MFTYILSPEPELRGYLLTIEILVETSKVTDLRSFSSPFFEQLPVAVIFRTASNCVSLPEHSQCLHSPSLASP